MKGYTGPRVEIVDDLPEVCSHCERHQGLCHRHERDVLPQLAQMYWYKLVKSGWVEGDKVVDAVDVRALNPEEKRRQRREARKRFKRSAHAAIATADKRKTKRRGELVRALKVA